jgi:hypothetical protein
LTGGSYTSRLTGEVAAQRRVRRASSLRTCAWSIGVIRCCSPLAGPSGPSDALDAVMGLPLTQ